MVSVWLNKSVTRIIFFQMFLTAIAYIGSAQVKQSFRNHEELELSGGMKVEILKCFGDGPTEECDCIYFTDKRQNGNRMRQNANTIKEELRAAEIAQGINKPSSKKSSSTNNNLIASRPDKAIPSSIDPVINAKPKARRFFGKSEFTKAKRNFCESNASRRFY
jgi:hypothetical protein